jgi:hypothetical protein
VANGGNEQPSGWELLRSLQALREQHEREMAQMRADSVASDTVLRERIVGLEEKQEGNQQYRRAIMISVATAILASTLSLVVSLVLHYAFT